MWKCNEGRYIQLTLGIWCWPLSENPLPPARQQPGPLTPSTQAIIQEETNQLKNQTPKRLYCIALACIHRTQG